MDLGGHRRSGYFSQQERAARSMQMHPAEEVAVFRRMTMVQPRLVISQWNRQAHYTHTTYIPTSQPVAYGPAKTPSRQPDFTRWEGHVAEPEPSHSPDIVPALHSSHKGITHAADRRLLTVRGHPVAPLRDDPLQACYLPAWNAPCNMQRTGR